MIQRIAHAASTCCAIGCFIILSIPTIGAAVLAWFVWGRG